MKITYPLDDINLTAREFLNYIGDRKVISFNAEMGAGKTTFINAICKESGSLDETGSPTFSLINEYTDGKGNPIYHFDFYRIETPEEALDLGLDEYFYSGNLCLIEWPGKIESLLPEDTLEVKINTEPDGQRTIIIEDETVQA